MTTREVCELKDSDELESKYILEYDTLFPNGYNLKLGTVTTYLSLEGRKRVSAGVQSYFSQQKFDRFVGVKFDINNIENYIHPLQKYKGGG